MLELGAELRADEVAAQERIHRALPGARGEPRLRIRIAADGRSGFCRPAQAVQHRGQHRCSRQIWVGIGAGNAVLDTGVVCIAMWDAQRHSAVVETPARIQRHEGIADEAAIAVGMRGEHQERGIGMPLQPGDGVAQRVCRRIGSAGQHVVPGAIAQAYVQMQPAAGLAGERLGHEAGKLALLLGNRLDGALEQDRLIAGGYRIGAMLQIDFELAGRVFGNGSVGRNALLPASRCDRICEAALVVQILQRIHLGAVVAFAGERVARRLRAPLRIGHRIEQVELQFYGDHRVQAERAKSLQHALQHRTWRHVEQPAFGGMHRQQQLRHRPWRPRHRA